MKVYPIRALRDNYMYLLVDEPTKDAAAVDPVNASAMADAVAKHDVNLKCVLTTHHHYDHANGNSDMLSMFPEIAIYGGDERIQALTKPVNHGDQIKLGSLTIECLCTPCHTRGHVCYYVHNEQTNTSQGIQTFPTNLTSTKSPGNSHQTSSDTKNQQSNTEAFPTSPPPETAKTQCVGSNMLPVERAVFTGDTLFIAGCGRFFEGNSEEMNISLNTTLGSLPPETKVYCGHEYTINNLRFALTVEPSNSDIKMKLDWAQNMVAKHAPTVPSTIGEEKRINPFMRLNKPQVKSYTMEQDELEVMTMLRRSKNEFMP